MSPNRASYYFATADRARGQDGEGARWLPRVVVARRDDDALDVRVDVVHRRAGRLGGIDAPPGTPELKLRPIVTARPHDAADDAVSVSSATTTTSAATTPSTRARGFHVKRRRRRRDHHHHDGGGSARMKDYHHHHQQKAETAGASEAGEEAAEPEESRRQHQHQQHGGGTRRRRWLYESLVVVKASSEPERELAESMAEMVAANGIRASEDLEELLACYLALNAAEHHRAVVTAFRRVWFHLARHHLV